MSSSSSSSSETPPTAIIASPAKVGSSSHEELTTKYSKLAVEYSKLRARFGVLKKAVIDEKNKNEELSDTLRERETTLRKTEAEMDSLTFRNQQLMKRVRILQADIDETTTTAAGRSNNKSRNNHHHHNDEDEKVANSVMSEELQHKIEENARLQSTLSDIEARYDEKISALESKIGELEAAVRRKAEKDRLEDSERGELIERLKADKAELTSRLSQVEKELADQADRIAVLKAQPEAVATQIVANMNSNGGGGTAYPLDSTDVQIQTIELLSQIGEQVHEFVASSSDFHTYWEHRLKDSHLSDDPLPSGPSALSKLLLKNVKLLKPIEQAYQNLLSDVLQGKTGEIHEFSSAFKKYVGYVMELEPMMIGCLQEEQSSIRNASLITSLIGYRSALEALSKTFEEKNLEEMAVNVSRLHREVNDLFKIYSLKSADENQLPTVTDQLKNTNQCICASLNSLSSCLNSLSRILSDNLSRIDLLLRSRITRKPTRKKEEEEDNINNSSSSKSIERVNNLNEVISKLNEKIKKVEQNREHWKLEFQLLEMKYQKLKESLNKNEDENEGEEVDIKKMFLERIDEIISEKMMADSKATSFYLECASLRKQIKVAEKQKKKMEAELFSAKEEAEKLKEEIQTTSTNYEMQLSMMSDHLATMNDRLTAQTDQISNLKYEMTNKKKK